MEGRPEDDSRLIARSRRGETAAYEEIVQRYQQIAFRTAYVITGSAPDAEDAAQEAFVKAYRALDRFRPGSELRPWLLRIVANEAGNRLRSSGPRGRPSGQPRRLLHVRRDQRRGHNLYLIQHLNGREYYVRLYDVTSGVLTDNVVIDKSDGNQAMAGVRLSGVATPGGH